MEGTWRVGDSTAPLGTADHGRRVCGAGQAAWPSTNPSSPSAQRLAHHERSSSKQGHIFKYINDNKKKNFLEKHTCDPTCPPTSCRPGPPGPEAALNPGVFHQGRKDAFMQRGSEWLQDLCPGKKHPPEYQQGLHPAGKPRSCSTRMSIFSGIF